MTNAAGGKTEHHTQFQTKAARWCLACAVIIISAQQACFAADIYRWVDADGRVHFSDTPHSAGDAAPLRAFKPAPTTGDATDLPDNHYSVLNQAKRMEINRLEQRGSRAASTGSPDPVRGERRRRGNRSGGGYVDDLDQLGYGVYSTLGPRTDLTKFPPPGHPVYSPTLGYPPNEYYRMGRHRPNTRLGGLPYARPARRGGVFGRR